MDVCILFVICINLGGGISYLQHSIAGALFESFGGLLFQIVVLPLCNGSFILLYQFVTLTVLFFFPCGLGFIISFPLNVIFHFILMMTMLMKKKNITKCLGEADWNSLFWFFSQVLVPLHIPLECLLWELVVVSSLGYSLSCLSFLAFATWFLHFPSLPLPLLHTHQCP